MIADPVRLDRVEFGSVVVTPRTEWTFALLRDVGGAEADVELTAGDSTAEVARLVVEAVATLRGGAIAGEADVPRLLGLDERRLRRDFAMATAVSTLRTAVSVIQSLNDGVSLTEALGGEPQASVPLYANINRGLFGIPRTPADFARAAERAVHEGFSAVKCAPFDEMSPGDEVGRARPGIRRVAAVRDAMGPDVTLLVDCHSRFDVESAVIVAEDMAGLGVALVRGARAAVRGPGRHGVDRRARAYGCGWRREGVRRGAVRGTGRPVRRSGSSCRT